MEMTESAAMRRFLLSLSKKEKAGASHLLFCNVGLSM